MSASGQGPNVGSWRSAALIDCFACEVATLSFVSADYLSANGRKIAPQNLSEDGAPAAGVAGKRVILCNLP